MNKQAKVSITSSFLFLIIGLLIFSLPVYAQWFMVRPTKLELQPYPGQTVQQTVELVNYTTQSITLDLKLFELTQDEQGHWRVIESGSVSDTPDSRSCLNWTSLSTKSAELKPMQTAPVTVTLKVPFSAHGFYKGALTVQTKPPEPKKGKIGIIIRFLIPILVELKGRPIRQKIELTDASMQFVEQSEKNSPTTLVSMNVVNKGETCPRVEGSIDVMRQVGKHWQKVASTEFRQVSIMPGVELNLKNDLKRRLPSGKYKLRGTLRVNGRRIKLLTKEMDFIGDSAITKVAADISLIFDPSILSIEAVPGSARAAGVKIQNLSEEIVNVSVGVETPKPFLGVSLDQLKGEDLSCVKWVKVIPSNFTLTPGRHRTIRITAKLPKNEKLYPNYYANLNFCAEYTDGQSAGENTSLIWLKNTKINAEPAAQIMRVSLVVEEDSKYVIQVKSTNTGNVHFIPECKAAVTNSDGVPVLETALDDQGQVMLPLEIKDFSGILDFSKTEEGIYRLSVSMDYGEKTEEVNKILPIQVSIEEGEKIVTVISVNEK